MIRGSKMHCIWSLRKGKEKDKRAEEILEDIMTKNFPKNNKRYQIQIQEIQRTTSKKLNIQHIKFDNI